MISADRSLSRPAHRLQQVAKDRFFATTSGMPAALEVGDQPVEPVFGIAGAGLGGPRMLTPSGFKCLIMPSVTLAAVLDLPRLLAADAHLEISGLGAAGWNRFITLD